MNKQLDLSTRALTMAIGLAAAATTLAAPAHADPVDDLFLTALRDGGLGFTDPASTVELGRTVCPMLVEPGKSVASAYSQVTNNGIPPQMAAFFTGIAISMYCPQMMSGVGNGTLLNWLPMPGL